MTPPPGPERSARRTATLDDRYQLEAGRIFLTGVQALVRLPFDQLRRDRAAGLRTGAFVTGYPGSPLGGYDLALSQALRRMPAAGLVHRPAQNEEMAATALMGTQLLERYPHAAYDGVVGFWYGKGPGLDRAGDAVRHGNYAGTTRHGAVVVLSGEDHEAKSSTMPYGQEHYFVHAGMPILHPASVAEFLELGLHAVAMSRHAGLWVAMKLVGQLCDGGEIVTVDPGRPAIASPRPELGGPPFQKRQYHRFFPGETVETERVLYSERLPAAVAYARANRLDRVLVATDRDRLAIVSSGKSFADTRQALDDLGLDDAALRATGIRLVKLALIHPLDRAFAVEALRGVEEVVVVEEKRAFLEEQLKAALYALADRPRILGKEDERGAPLFPDHGGMDADLVAERLGPRLLPCAGAAASRVSRRLDEIRAVRAREVPSLPRRTPNYCSGCPHNASTLVLPGQVAWSAPGCHVFATLIDQPERHADATFQLGGEGLAWVGLAPFTDLRHVVQNQGDGGLFHSSYLNIRFAVASGVRITFRILYNGAVANTGAQEPVGQRDVPTLARLLALEGVRRIAIVARDPARYRGVDLPAAAQVHGREAMGTVLRDLAAIEGVTVLLHDGECANERRRKEKRGGRAPPSRFVLVNEEVCESCGHCGALTNCMSLHKVETELGEKTQVHQSSCNQDRLCLGGDCPSFVSVDVRGGGRRRPATPAPDVGTLPEPALPRLDRPFHVVMPGVGGTGVLTVNSILAWAALLDGKQALSYDQTGAAQKWGAVLSSLVLSEPLHAPPAAGKVGVGRADLYLALDAMAAADPVNLARCAPERTAAVVNTTLLPSGEMIRDVHLDPGLGRMVEAISRVCDPERTVKLEARRLAEALFGDHLAANVLALGAAWQAGLLPLSARAIEDAIRQNGTAVEQNLSAFRHGRIWFHAPESLERRLRPPAPSQADVVEREGARLGRRRRAYEELLARYAELDEESRRLLPVRVAGLLRHQDAAWAGRYLDVVLDTFRRERRALGPRAEPRITREVIRNLHMLMAYKDEYEVARLHLEAAMQRRAEAAFSGRVRIHYHLHPPILRALGMRRKLRLGRWIEPVLWLLARVRWLRATPLDPFGHTEVRRLERRLIEWYPRVIDRALDDLRPQNHAVAIDLAQLPDRIRGYERLKIERARAALDRAEVLLRDIGGNTEQA